MSEWTSVLDQLPEEKEHVLLFFGQICVGYRTRFCDTFQFEHWPCGDYASSSDVGGVTHWMPLPQSPEAAKNNQD